MGEKTDRLNVAIFKLRIKIVAYTTLDGEQLSPAWGGIKLDHYISQYITQYLNMTDKALGQR